MNAFHRLVHRARRSEPDESGVVLVLLAVGLVVFLAVAAVAIDLGVGYASSRQMQNAADAAALAGAQEMECLKFAPTANTVGCQVFPATSAAIASVVSSAATTNGADATKLTCEVISGYIPGANPDYEVYGACSDTGSWMPYLNNPDALGQEADGVYVESGTSEQTVFGSTTGVRQLTENRQAAATVQSLVGGGSPLLACAFNQVDQTTGKAAAPLLLASTSSASGYVENPAAIYNPSTQSPAYFLHGPQVDKCKLSSDSWKGLADESGAWPTLPALLPILTGDKAGPTRVAVANQSNCSSLDSSQGCVLVLPICTDSNNRSGISGSLYCVGYGAFELLSSDANSQNFGFLGLANASGGQTGTGNPDANGVNVVTLIQ